MASESYAPLGLRVQTLVLNDESGTSESCAFSGWLSESKPFWNTGGVEDGSHGCNPWLKIRYTIAP